VIPVGIIGEKMKKMGKIPKKIIEERKTIEGKNIQGYKANYTKIIGACLLVFYLPQIFGVIF
jgi:hypothetical protein